MYAVLVVLLAGLAGCGTTWDPVAADAPSVTRPLAGSRAELIAAARSVLLARGFGLTRSNTEAGVLATTWEPRRLTAAEADCGRRDDGRPWLEIEGVVTRVAYGLRVPQGGHTVTIQARVRGEGPDGADLACRSTGGLEHRLYRRIAAKVPLRTP